MNLNFLHRRWVRLLAVNLIGLAVLIGGSLAGFAQGTGTTGSGTGGGTPTGSGVTVPEPASIALMVSALGGLSFVVTRRRRKSPQRPGIDEWGA